MLNQTKYNTIQHRNELIDDLKDYDNNTIVLYLIETLKKYSQDEDMLTGQYMMVLDAVQKVLINKNFLKKTETWTLEEFLNDIPFHSILSSDSD